MYSTGLINFLVTPAGQFFLYFCQAILFSVMLYILAAEFVRTRDRNLIYKLLAACSITVISAGTSVIYMLEAFYGVSISQKYFPLVFNTLFMMNVFFLARAFTYEFVLNKKRFSLLINTGMIMSAVIYVFMQIYWLAVFTEGMLFWRSSLQLILSLFFVMMLGSSIHYIIRFRKNYRARLVTGFSSIAVVQLINVYGSLTGDLPSGLAIVKAALPMLVPVMFTSVVFKELIGRVVSVVEQLRITFEHQRDLVFELINIGAELSSLSDSLVKSSLDGWSKLSSVALDISEQLKGCDRLTGLTVSSSEELRKMDCELIEAATEKIEAIVGSSDDRQRDDSAIAEALKRAAELVAGSSSTAELIKSMLPAVNSAIDAIDDISDRTNILSLNASIEAARAGVHGRGFAIVAEEIGRLAESSLSGSRDVKNGLSAVLELLKSFSENSVRAMECIEGAASGLKSNQGMQYQSGSEDEPGKLSAEIKQYISGYRKCAAKLILGTESAEVEIDKSRGLAAGMKLKISAHIADIESIAGISDTINGLVSKLNAKINVIIEQTGALERLSR